MTSDRSTFERLTGTIVRQVGDLRRMVDEFSSFARMPKPTFREEPVVEIARQALFLHEVAHPEIDFALDAPDPSPTLVCDRRLLGQALTNVVKNAVEAIELKKEQGGEGDSDRIEMKVSEPGGKLVIEVRDSGVGLPADRGRLTEPYVTTRAKGTGLGLAIVKKIVEEHFGQIEFEDHDGGGSLVRFVFDAEVLERLGALSDFKVSADSPDVRGWPVESIEDVKLAPFHLLASEGADAGIRAFVLHPGTVDTQFTDEAGIRHACNNPVNAFEFRSTTW